SARESTIVERVVGGTLTQEKGARIFRLNRRKRPRGLMEIEVAVEAGGARVGRPQTAQSETVLDEPDDASELVTFMVHDVLPRVRGYDQHRNAHAQTLIVNLRRRDMVVKPAPVVPKHDDGRRVPILTIADGVYRLRDPRRPRVGRCAGMVRVVELRAYPRNRRQMSRRNVGQQVGGLGNVGLPLGTVTHGRNGIERVPNVSSKRLADLGRVVFPTDALGVEQIAQGSVVDAG